MNQKPILGLIDAFRGELPLEQSALLAATLVTWQKLSQASEIGSDFALSDVLAKSPRDAEKALARLADSREAGVFREAADMLSRTSHRVASEALQMAMLQGQQGLLDTYDPSDLVTIFGNTGGGGFYLPPEICDLLVALAGDDIAKTEVYLPWDENGQLLGRFLKKGSRAAVEVNGGMVQLPNLVRAYYEPTPISRIQVSDPIKSPTYTEKGRLTRFGLTVATPPFGVRVDFEGQAKDPFSRFPEKTNSMTVLAVRHVLAQTDGRVVIAVTNSILFAAGGEKRLRKDLLEHGQLEAVIGLPAGLLAGTAIPLSILVLNSKQRHDQVRLVNCDEEKYKFAESRTRFKLVGIEEIANLALGRSKGTGLRVLSRKEIYDSDLSLLPSRYVLDAAMSRLDGVLANYSTQSLEEQAEILRPIVATQVENSMPAFEVGASDLFNSGYITSPTKKVSVASLPDKNTDQFLRPLDIVMVIKGSVGKVSIAPTDTPAPGPGGWVAGQSMAIIRTQASTNPRALVTFLRSDIGQELIRRLIAGAAIPFLQIRELRQMKMPMLNSVQSDRAASVLEEQQKLRLELTRLQERLDAMRVEEWQLPEEPRSVETI